MMRLISWSCIMTKLTIKRSWEKEKNRNSVEEVDWYSIYKNVSYQKTYTFWHYVVNDEVLSEVVLPEYLSWMTKYQTKNKVTNTISPKKDFRKLNGFGIAYYICYHPN